MALDESNFEETVATNAIVLVDFWAAWCVPCRMFAPVYEAAAERHPDVLFGKVDTEAAQELAAGFGIRSIPTLAAFRDGVLIFARPGALRGPELDGLITKVKELDMGEVHQRLQASQAAHR